MINDLVSIIMPTYNSAEFVSRSIEGIISQTYTNWELLITDDCSCDDTLSVLEEFSRKDERIRYFVLPENGGGGVARSNSIRQAKGRYLAFCDSDDVWVDTKLEKQLKFMGEKQCLLSFTSYTLIDENEKEIGEVNALKKVTYRHEIMDNALGCSTVIYDTEKFGKIYFSPIRKRQDWAFMLRVLRKTRVAYGMEDKLVKYTVRSNSVSRNKFDLVKYNIAIYREELGLSKITSYLLFGFVFMPYYIFKKLIK